MDSNNMMNALDVNPQRVDEEALRRQVTAMIPAQRIYELTWRQTDLDDVFMESYVASSMSTDTVGNLLFFRISYQHPGQLVSSIVRIVAAGEVENVQDMGEVPVDSPSLMLQ